MRCNHFFNLTRPDLKTANLNHLFLSIDDIKIAIPIHPGDIPGMKPAIPKSFAGLFGPVMIFTHHLRAADEQFPDLLLLESALLLVIALLWRLTGWYTIASYSDALTAAGGLIVGVGLLGLTGGRSSDDMKLVEAEMEMRSWDHKGQRRFISPFAERTRMWSWLIGLGIATIVMGIVLNVFFP